MSQADAINSRAAEFPDWLQLFIDILDPPHEEPGKLQRISSILHENNEEYYKKYYTPIFVPIGPIHCQNLDGQSMKKRIAVKQLQGRLQDEVSIGEVYASVEEKLLSARNRYSCDIIESFQDDRKWCNMMFLDGCFVVDFICRYCSRPLYRTKDYEDLVLRDLLLYENQLPFEVLDALADAFRCKETFHKYLTLMLLERPFMLTKSSVPASTFLDNIESCLCIKFRRYEDANSTLFAESLLDAFEDSEEHIRNSCVILFGTEGAPPPASTVTDLQKVGIKCSSSTSLSDISFYSYMLSGKLFLPQLTFDHWRMTLILNLAAYEFSCGPNRSCGISSYLSSMGTFIHGEEDVKELRARGLVQLNHKDYDDHAVVDFFRYITMHHEPNPKVMKRVKGQISTYCKSKRLLPLRVASAEFKQRYNTKSLDFSQLQVGDGTMDSNSAHNPFNFEKYSDTELTP
ncbi:UPF0481 protein At3g47200-like [Lycium ferocissimum]|uniref:UPF0481 protein At3g47200-like n=1 Tax=Lycium ferocissimum TaxID=112874 RepID=UPI002815AE85|nr:UPF0481 protein At3g47200-like [Lycium ferocissimum]